MLPEDAQQMLQKAASVDPNARRGESIHRRMAIDRAVMFIRNTYPYLFRSEEDAIVTSEVSH